MHVEPVATHFFDVAPPRIFAHRGDSRHFPENTLAAFCSAMAYTRYIELDVWLSRDGEVMVHHDESLRRTCGLDRAIYDLSVMALRCLDAGAWFWKDGSRPAPVEGVPTLADVLDACPNACVTVEIKHDHPQIGPRLRRVIAEAGAGHRVLFAGEPDCLMRHARKHLSEFPGSMSYTEIRRFIDWIRAGKRGQLRLQGRALQVPLAHEGFILADQAVIGAAHEAGYEIQFWTINDPSVMRALFTIGADVIMTDDPASGHRVINR